MQTALYVIFPLTDQGIEIVRASDSVKFWLIMESWP
jgi:hypothetical protein